MRTKILETSRHLLDQWMALAKDAQDSGMLFQYQREESSTGSNRLIWEFLNKELDSRPPECGLFRANRSMRDVEPSVDVWIKSPYAERRPAANG